MTLACLVAILAGCVTRDQYDAALSDGEQARAKAASCEAAAAALRGKLDDAAAVNAALDERVRRQGTTVEALLNERAGLDRAVRDARARLDQIRRAKEASEARAALFRALAVKLQRMTDAGSLRIALRDGRMVLLLATDVLFDSGKVDIKPEGREALAELASVLVTIPRRHFQVAGHTDTVPISTLRFPSNWELSAGRAVEVTRFLISRGLAPGDLSAAGYGEFDPVAPNDRPEERARNRRIEISLVPNIDELVSVPQQ